MSIYWETPPKFFDHLHEHYGFMLDVCATPENAKCKQYFTERDNALMTRWDRWKEKPNIYRSSCWMNPPYGDLIKPFIERAIDQTVGGFTNRVVALLPANTDPFWFHEYIYRCPFASYKFLEGRLAFLDENKIPQKGSNVKNMVVEWSLKPHILPSITLKHAKEYNR